MVSEEDGAFSFTGVRGKVSVTAMPFGLPPARQSVTVEAGQQVDLQILVPSVLVTLEGRVVDESGFGIDGALVTVRSLRSTSPVRRTTRSEPNGDFAISALPSPPFQLTVEHTGYSKVTVNRVEDDDEIQVVLRPGLTLVGRVLDDWTGAGVAEALIEIKGTVARKLRTNDDGAFRARQVPAGDYELTVQHADYEPHAQPLSIERPRYLDRTHEIDAVRLLPAGAIAGEVRDVYGSPVPNAQVTWGDPPTWGRAVTTDAQGEFLLRGVSPGTVWVSARHAAAGEAIANRPVTVRPQDTSPGAYVRLPERLDAETTTEEERTESGVAITLTTTDEEVRIATVDSESAAGAHLQAGDVLLVVDGQPVASEAQARALLLGAAGVEVVVQVSRDGEPDRTFVLPRERFEVR